MHELAMYGDEAFMRLVESGLSPTLAKRHGAALCGILHPVQTCPVKFFPE